MVNEYCQWCQEGFEREPVSTKSNKYFDKGACRCPKCHRTIKKNGN
jgi:hypothetical protein